jgi:hypothetical protein
VRMFSAINVGAVEQIRKQLCCSRLRRNIKQELNYYITVELEQADLETYAEQQEYQVKLLEMDSKYKYIKD